mmetsp:Transcript_79950/g.226186  ORF Transcript_79950/g.226186 Transcript_79950/m.226186 type:complete len:299 (-) Transcript_79950:510-1406(-)
MPTLEEPLALAGVPARSPPMGWGPMQLPQQLCPVAPAPGRRALLELPQDGRALRLVSLFAADELQEARAGSVGAHTGRCAVGTVRAVGAPCARPSGCICSSVAKVNRELAGPRGRGGGLLGAQRRGTDTVARGGARDGPELEGRQLPEPLALLREAAAEPQHLRAGLGKVGLHAQLQQLCGCLAELALAAAGPRHEGRRLGPEARLRRRRGQGQGDRSPECPAARCRATRGWRACALGQVQFDGRVCLVLRTAWRGGRWRLLPRWRVLQPHLWRQLRRRSDSSHGRCLLRGKPPPDCC